mgnify:CR=1 FL=1
MLEKLEAVYAHFKEIELLLSSPEVASDVKRFTKLNKEYRDLEEIVQSYFEYKNCYHRIAEARDILKNEKDKELRDMARRMMRAGVALDVVCVLVLASAGWLAIRAGWV